VFRGLAAGRRGVAKRRKAVGPREGKTKGVFDTIATPPRIAIVMKPLIKTKSARTGLSG
jgi:hypothetical protein